MYRFSEVTSQLAGGGAVIVIAEGRATGDLVLAADRVSAAGINLQVTHARGLTELALSPARIAQLRLPPMISDWEAPRKAFAISIEARHGVSTGISAPDRAATIRAAVAEGATDADLVSPGHVFPLRARTGALSDLLGEPDVRAEAAVALATLAGCGEGAVLSAILDDEGEVASGAALWALAGRIGCPCVSVAEIAAAQLQAKAARLRWEPEVRAGAVAPVRIAS